MEWARRRRRWLVDHLFANDPENGKVFWDKVKSADKDAVTKPDFDEQAAHEEGSTVTEL